MYMIGKHDQRRYGMVARLGTLRYLRNGSICRTNKSARVLID